MPGKYESSTAVFDSTGEIRWRLARVWGNRPPVLWLMCNPSNANALIDDPTISRCVNFTKAWGFTSLQVCNVYPWVSSSPEAVKRKIRDARGYDSFEALAPALKRNEGIVRRVALASAMIVAAWGEIAAFDIYTGHFATILQEAGVDLHCLAVGRNGAPMHPLARGRSRIPAGAKPLLWRKSESIPQRLRYSEASTTPKAGRHTGENHDYGETHD